MIYLKVTVVLLCIAVIEAALMELMREKSDDET